MKDHHHIEMEDISQFPIERSEDYVFWEPVSHEELNKILETLPEEKVKTFLGIVRNGSSFLLKDTHYRIKAR